MFKLLYFCKPYRWSLIPLVFATFLQTFGQLLIPFYTANIINNGVIPGDIDYIISTGILMLFIALIAGLASIYAVYLSSKLSALLGRDLRQAVFSKSTTLTVPQFKHFGASSLITRSTNDINQITMLYSWSLQFLLPGPLLAIGGFALALSRDVTLTIVLFTTVLIISIASYIICIKAVPLFMKLQPKMDSINRLLRELITGVRVIRAFNAQKNEQQRFEKTAQEYAQIAIKINKIFAYYVPIIILTMNLGMVAILWFGGIGLSTGNVQIGDIMAIIEYSVYIMTSVMMMSFVLFYIPRVEISAKRINEIIEMEASNNDASVTVTDFNSDINIIEFKDVEFSYPNAEKPVLKNINFTAKKGETIALVGTTGSGKSTLVSLIPRFYEITQGEILLNGVNISQIPLKNLREKIGFVTQKPFIFSGTIKDSLHFGKPDANQSEIDHAIKLSQAFDFVQQKGINEIVSQEGINLSGGQKQRLSIARAIIRKPEIYIFDDSFSALDYKTDKNLRTALKNEVKNTIYFIVAQRISTIKNADKILVLDQGEIVALGSHKTLINTCEIYKNFATTQMNESELLA